MIKEAPDVSRDESVRRFADRLLDQLLQRIGDLPTLPPAHLDLLRRCCLDAADLQLRAMAAPDTADARLALLREKAHLQAQLASLGAAQAARVTRAFWETVRDAVSAGVSIAFAAV
jgi:hypothetical protein